MAQEVIHGAQAKAKEMLELPNPGQHLLDEMKSLLDRLVALEGALNVATILIGKNVSAQDQGVWQEALAACEVKQ